MGYRRETRIYNLVFADPEYNGLEVRVRSLSVGRLRQFLKFRDLNFDSGEGADIQATEDMLEMFASSLLSWNLEDGAGFEIPANRQGIDSQDMDFVMSIIGAWVQTVSGVPNESPLPEPSSVGEQFPEGSIPMETLSQSQAS